MNVYLYPYREVLRVLSKDNKNSSEIKKLTSISYSKLSPIITKLIKQKSIREESGIYKITKKGRRVKDIINELFITLED